MSRGYFSFLLNSSSLTLCCFSTLRVLCSLDESARSLCTTYGFIYSFTSLVGPSGLEPPTSCLSGTRSNLLSYEPMWLVSDFSSLGLFGLRKEDLLFLSFRSVGIELFSRTVSRKVSSPLQSLTSVFGMGTGGPSAFVTPTFQES